MWPGSQTDKPGLPRPSMYIYLASPYTSPDPRVRERRCRDVQYACARLLNAGHHVYSPIAHWHPIDVVYDLPKDQEFYRAMERKLIRYFDELWVLALDGWHISVGIEHEVLLAREYGKPIRVLDPVSLVVEPYRARD